MLSLAMLASIPRYWIYGGLVALLFSVVVYQRYDAVSDFKDELKADRVGHVEDAREIEIDSSGAGDDEFRECLQYGLC